MIGITYENCPSYQICCGSGDRDLGTGFVIKRNLILTARHVVTNAILDEETAIMLEIPGRHTMELEICGPAKEKMESATLVMLRPKNPQENLPAPPPFYRHAVRIEEGTPMKTYGYRPGDSGKHAYELKSYAGFSVDNPIEGAEKRTEHFVMDPKDGSGLSGSPILCKGRLVGILIAQMTQAGECEYLYGFGGDAFFQELDRLGIQIPASPVPPELNEAAFSLPKDYQRKLTAQLNEALEIQRSSRADDIQKPIFLWGPAGIGKKEFLWAFAKQYSEGYVYHLEFKNSFRNTLNQDTSGIIENKESEGSHEQLRLLQECSAADILIITGADFAEWYSPTGCKRHAVYDNLCKLPLHLVIATQQPIPANLGHVEPLTLELKPPVEELVTWAQSKYEDLEDDDVKLLVEQADSNPLLIHTIMAILAVDPNLEPKTVVKALQNPGESNLNLYRDTEELNNLFALLENKTPHPKDHNKNDEIYRSILWLIHAEFSAAQGVQGTTASANANKFLTVEEFDAWVHSTDLNDKRDRDGKITVPDAFEKLRRIGMIERSSLGCYTIPIIPRLLLRREQRVIDETIDNSLRQYRNTVFDARVRIETAETESEAEMHRKAKANLLNKLVQECADPYDGFSRFCAANKQALETCLPELLTFGKYINQALARCGCGEDPMEELEKAETFLAQICQDAQDQRTILTAKLYDMFRSVLYMLKYDTGSVPYMLGSDTGADPEVCRDALVTLFEAVAKLRENFIPCYTMKSQVYWYFDKEDEAAHAAEEAINYADCAQGHCCADAFMILGRYLENQAASLRETDTAESCNYYKQAWENYSLARDSRNEAERKNLQQNRQDLCNLIRCMGNWYLLEPQRWIDSNKILTVWTLGLALLKNDAIRKNEENFVEDSKRLLRLCCYAEMVINRTDTNGSNAKDIAPIKQKIHDYIRDKCPTEAAWIHIAAYKKDLAKLIERMRNPDTPDAHNG